MAECPGCGGMIGPLLGWFLNYSANFEHKCPWAGCECLITLGLNAAFEFEFSIVRVNAANPR